MSEQPLTEPGELRLFDVDREAPAVDLEPAPASESPRPEPRRGWFHITLEAADVLGAHFPAVRAGKRLPLKTARTVYTAFAEVANEERAGAGAFTAYRGRLADRASVSVRTLGAYADELVKAGLLERCRIRSGRRHEPNQWRLPLHARGDFREATGAISNDLDGQRVTPPAPVRGATSDTPLKKYVKEGNVVHLSPRDEQRERQARRLAALERATQQEASL